MKKIPCVFKRDFTNPKAPKILNEVTPGCEWVLAGEGVATVKHDGSACLIKNNQLYKRYDAKRGKSPPAGFEPAQDPDPVTGHWPGWVPVDVRNPDPADVWHALAWQMQTAAGMWKIGDGTFELCGPRVNGNHDRLSHHMLIRHGCAELKDSDRSYSFDGLRFFLATFPHEGIVFWRRRGNTGDLAADATIDMAKLTREHFGFPWPMKKEQ